MENKTKGKIGMFQSVIGIVDIVVGVIGIIVTLISIIQTANENKKHQKSNRTDQS